VQEYKVVVKGKNLEEKTGGRRGGAKNKWGSVLVELRPSRVPRDGRTAMEKSSG
jgi:hypothetical protein